MGCDCVMSDGIITAFTQCPDSGVEPGRWVRSILQGFIDPHLDSDPTHGTDPASGAERMSSSMKFCTLHLEKFHTLLGQTRLSVYTQNMVSDPACGVEPYKFAGVQKAGQTPQVGQVLCVYTEGQKRVWPRKWFSTPQLGHCVNAVFVCSMPKYWSVFTETNRQRNRDKLLRNKLRAWSHLDCQTSVRITGIISHNFAAMVTIWHESGGIVNSWLRQTFTVLIRFHLLSDPI